MPCKPIPRREWLRASAAGLLAPSALIATEPHKGTVEGHDAIAHWLAHDRDELFHRSLPFWDQHGIDHRRGGFQCSLDYDGRKVDTNKFHWYQGRGIWVYSHLHNHFRKDLGDDQHRRCLEIARRAADFWLAHGPNQDGWWPELLSADGRILKPFRRDVYSAFTTIEGCQELATATGDQRMRDQARRWLVQAYRHVTAREFHDPYAREAGWRVQGIWIYVLNCCTQMLAHDDNRQLRQMADTCIDALIDGHHDKDTGLNSEFTAHDFSRLPPQHRACLVGHCLQGLWHVIKEARRRKDKHLEATCCKRIRRHLDVGWDKTHGGLCEWVNLGQTEHEWGPQKLGSQTIPLRMKGEYNYVKSFWALNELLIATLLSYETTGASWAWRYFVMAQQIADRHFSRREHGQATHRLATDRRFRFVPRSTRQDNYHPLRRLMVNLKTLGRLSAG